MKVRVYFDVPNQPNARNVAAEEERNSTIRVRFRDTDGDWGIVATANYHRRQAETLIRLANSTRDPETATALMRLAAEHNALAEEAAGIEKKRNGGLPP
jgi:hypothetical protein